jgi:phosphoserine phosphatase
MKITLLHPSHVSDSLINEVSKSHAISSIISRTKHSATLGLVNPISVEEKLKLGHLCLLHEADLVTLKRGFDPSQIKLLAMDMDSTLINIECIDEIADAVGRKKEVSEITEAAMRGEIKDFSESLTRRVELLAGVPESALLDVYETRLKLNPGASELIRGAQARGWHTLLVSGGFNFFTEKLAMKLGLDETHANTLEVVSGLLTGRVIGKIVDGQAKADYVQARTIALGSNPNSAVVMGDGSNDLPMMAHAGLSIGYKAKPIVKEKADGAFDHVGLDALLEIFPL